MLSRSHQRHFWMRSSSHAWRRWCMVWMLCLCAWRGPVPVVHCHALEVQGEADAQSSWQLAQHMAICHAGEHDHASDSGWHVHFVVPSKSGDSQGQPELPLYIPVLAELMTHASDSCVDAPVSSQTIDAMADFVGPFNQTALTPSTPKLIPLAPPRSRPSRVSPRIYYCVAQC